MRNRINIAILWFLAIASAAGQAQERQKLVQVNGIITDDESKPVPHVSIVSKRIKRGTVSEMTGVYSLISLPGDTILISALGYKRQSFNVPSDIEGKFYKKDISLVSDTISIEGVNIFPWKTYEEFKRDVLANQPVMRPEIQYMYDNLAAIQYAIANIQSYKVSPEAGYRLAMQQHADAYVTKNQYPVNNLLNPFAWAKFFSGVKNGLLKNQKSTQTTKAKTKSRNKNTTGG